MYSEAAGFELYARLEDKLAENQSAINQLRIDGEAEAMARRNYRVALAKEELRLRLEEKLPASMISDVARGDEDVAQKRYLLSCAETAYKASYEATMLRKREVDTIREQIAREYADSRYRQ